jgi:hypothetical protein
MFIHSLGTFSLRKINQKIFLKRGTMNWFFFLKKVCRCIFWFSQRIFSKHFLIYMENPSPHHAVWKIIHGSAYDSSGSFDPIFCNIAGNLDTLAHGKSILMPYQKESFLSWEEFGELVRTYMSRLPWCSSSRKFTFVSSVSKTFLLLIFYLLGKPNCRHQLAAG